MIKLLRIIGFAVPLLLIIGPLLGFALMLGSPPFFGILLLVQKVRTLALDRAPPAVWSIGCAVIACGLLWLLLRNRHQQKAWNRIKGGVDALWNVWTVFGLGYVLNAASAIQHHQPSEDFSLATALGNANVKMFSIIAMLATFTAVAKVALSVSSFDRGLMRE